MSKIIRLTDKIAIEFQDIENILLKDIGLYNYHYANKQLLNNDDFEYNNRNISFCPDLNNVLLRTTPYPYVSEAQHLSFSLLPQFQNLTLNHIKCRLLFAAGFEYLEEEWGIGLEIYVNLDNGTKLYLTCQYDEKTDSKIEPNSDYIVLENVIFNQGFDLKILDIQSLSASTESNVINLRNLLLESTSNITEYIINFFYINKLEVLDFQEDAKPFKRLEPTQKFTQYYKTESGDIYNKITLTDNSILSVILEHISYNLKDYFKRICGNDGENFKITHQIDFQAYSIDSSNESGYSNVGLYSVKLSNTENYFNSVELRPYMPDYIFEENVVDHIKITLTSEFNDSTSGILMTRRTSKIIENLQIFKDEKITLNLDKIEVKEKINKIENKIVSKTEIPNVVKIPVNYFYERITNSILTLTPYNNTCIIEDIPYNINDTLFLRLGSSKYPQLSNDNGKLIFNVPSFEYYKKEEKFYITNDSNETLLSGNVIYQ